MESCFLFFYNKYVVTELNTYTNIHIIITNTIIILFYNYFITIIKLFYLTIKLKSKTMRPALYKNLLHLKTYNTYMHACDIIHMSVYISYCNNNYNIETII